MGQSSSTPAHQEVPVEQISQELALRFAEKCYTHLEIAHFRDNFKTLADHQDGVEYWKEETLCRFLSIPNALHAGPIVYQMATYLGSFPFPSLAPSILTREAMIKVITILTGRYRKVLKRGDQDKNKLLFRSMAVFDRRSSIATPVADYKPADLSVEDEKSEKNDGVRKQTSRFAIDDPLNDGEEEDDDDLALAALESLDAIEVFQHDQRKEVKLHRAHVPADYLHKLIMLVLLFAPLKPQDNLGAFSESLDSDKQDLLAESATALIAAFDPDPVSNGIKYTTFVTTIVVTMANLFRPLNPLFEHFLFSKNIDLSKHRGLDSPPSDPTNSPSSSPIERHGESSSSTILNDVILAQISMSLEISSSASLASSSFFHCGAGFHEIYSTASHGTSMSSFSRQVLSWRSATLFLLSGSTEDNQRYTFGAYLPDHWRDSGSSQAPVDVPVKAALFQLKPRHAVFFANKHNKAVLQSHFSTKTGIGIGCILPAQSRVQNHHQPPILGPVSLIVDEDISVATFQHDADAGIGAFCTDPGLETAQRLNPTSSQPKKVQLDIEALEIWGVNFSTSGNDEITNQKKRLDWEEAEAARRRGVNFGGDKDGARALLEMAGIVGDASANRSGGSV